MTKSGNSNSIGQPQVFFTAPWEPIIVRRGDALGLRAVTDQFANAVAPHLSNRIQDGRWVTILAWCISRSQDVYTASGERMPETQAQQRARYAWLQPLELMWVARAISLAPDDWRQRQLPGRRKVLRWYEDDKQRGDNFGMSADQYKGYRQTGMYGAFRLAFRHWPGLTTGGDGWTPGPATHKLAHWLDTKLGTARPSWHLGSNGSDTDEGSLNARSIKISRGKEDRWWRQHWEQFDEGGRAAINKTLPSLRTDHSVLPEAKLLRPLIFGADYSGRRRHDVACALASLKVNDHLDLCKGLARKFPQDAAIALLPQFSRLADAGMEAMDMVAQVLGTNATISITQVCRHPDAKRICAELFAAAKDWPRATHFQMRHIESVDQFADTFVSATPSQCIAALLDHHMRKGGGLRWFGLRSQLIEAGSPGGSGSSRYRFRFWSLCRLAAQCGVIKAMPAGMVDLEAAEEEAMEAMPNE
jgi:hypothetical protein